MGFTDEYIQRLTDQNVQYRARVQSWEAGGLQFLERKSGGEWTDKTAQWIAEDKQTIAINEAIIAKFEADRKA